MAKLTKAQARALTYLASATIATPADIGTAMSDRKHLKAQGAGRIGGSMAKRLIAQGHAEDASRLRGGFPAYRITPAGRAALEAANKEGGER